MPPVVVLVEGASDAAVVRVLCGARGVDPESVDLRDMGGVTNVGHHLRELDGRAHVLGLYDAPEERFVVRGLRSTGRDVTDQLHRFAGTASGRKLLLARRLAEELSPATTPAPLTSLVDQIADAASRS